ncbi:hypothetical protein D9M71_353820 [compost metagenome]
MRVAVLHGALIAQIGDPGVQAGQCGVHCLERVADIVVVGALDEVARCRHVAGERVVHGTGAEVIGDVTAETVQAAAHQVDRLMGSEQLTAVNRIGAGAGDASGRDVADLAFGILGADTDHAGRLAACIDVGVTVDHRAGCRLCGGGLAAGTQCHVIVIDCTCAVTQGNRVGGRGAGVGADGHRVVGADLRA